MRILVTGGAGFIGSHIVDELVDLGHDVLNVDCISSDAHIRPPSYLNDSAEHRVEDVRDREAMIGALRSVDAVCHQAGRVGLGVDFNDVDQYISHNDHGMATLLQAMWQSSFKGRLVLASSMVVYGEGRYECPDHGIVQPGLRVVEQLDAGNFEPPCPVCGASLRWTLVPEDAPLDPRNVYASTKLHQEHLANAFSREAGVPVTSLRYHNVYGPRMPRNTPYAGVASLFRSALEAGDQPLVFEDGNQTRDFVHVRDVAHVNVLALTSPDPVVGAFNVCSGTPTTVGHMAEILAKHSDNGGLSPVITGKYRLGDVRHVVASPVKAQQFLGYSASISFDDGMAEFATAPLREAL